MLHIIMTQYALKTGLRKFKKRGEAEVTKEITQMNVLEAFSPVGSTKLTKKRRSEVVASLLFLKYNHNE